MVVAVAICAVPAGLLSPVATADPAQGAPAAQQAEAAEVPDATLQDKVRAASALGIVADDELLVLGDRNFVFELWSRAEGEEVRASAELALGETDSDAACTAWIKNGVHEAVKRDQADELRDAEKARIARELKRNGAMVIGIEPPPEMLVLGYRDFVYELWDRAEGERVKAAALEAFGADEAAQKQFLAEGIREAHEQDQLDAIEEDEQASEEEKARQRARAAKDRAMRSVLGVVPTEGMLDLSDDNFIREVWDRAEPDTEVQAAAVAALRSSDPAVWKQFIEVGIYDADERDKANELREQEEADRKRVLEIKTWAENSLVHPGLAHAAQTALDSGPADVSHFLRYGQYDALVQSLQADTRGVRGWYIRNGEDGPASIHPGEPVPGPEVGTDANWKVIRGLADPECHSMEVVGRPGVYLRQQDLRVKVQPSDGSDQFRADATWCSELGLQGGGVSLESFGQPGRYLRHIDGQLWAANDSGEHWFDNAGLFIYDASWRVHGENPVSTGLLLRWLNDDQIRGRLGWPVDEEQADGDVRWRDYEHGRMYWTGETGAKQMEGPVLTKYVDLGGHRTAIGVPITDQHKTPDGIGRYNHFSHGPGASIYWSPDTGAHLIHGAIRKKWAELGWEKGLFGYPITDELVASDGVGRYNDFDYPDGGSIYWSPDSGAHEIHGAIRSIWKRLGAEQELGYPTTDETKTPDGVGRYNHLTHPDGASIYWSPNSGAHAVRGKIRDKWSALGWERSRLGYPVAGQTESGGVLTQRFQGGRIEHDKETGRTTVHYG
ncbi:AbfB domain-containing protein [Amycolatopsis cihanbeyliensis]|uniref:Short repeat uncharacterized protein predicted to be involved in signal transduction n=1 Tax=Amycolatopsis cihanbeyliensis TaxID=1128664 RepID=A0A542DG10_AMYCI|nr:AbfB domain-containing protein [Amycolatopsis cihanbeyliensis]TQJ02023.1 short repeat uncharacterized protein predicted to be involved in signal transduction [Amycolatopsis cihanbeyliensis]